MKLKRIIQRGQVMVLYAILIPLLFLFVGVGMDLGWYYLTVSRLQNAADAAVLAGAWKLVDQNDMSQYFVTVLMEPPKDISEYNKVRINGELQSLETSLVTAGTEAQTYSAKNLGTVSGESTILDDWNTSTDIDLHKVTMTTALYAKTIDAQWREDSIRYYKVTLSEQVSHLFLRGFEPMTATVTAYAQLQPHDVDMLTIVRQLENSKVIANWQYQDTYKDFDGNWNHYRQTVNGEKAVSYVAGDYFRTETVNVEVGVGDTKNNGFNGTKSTSSGLKTSANGSKYYSELEVDALNIDFNQDIATQFSVDWDLGATTSKNLSYVAAAMSGGWDKNQGDLRVQGRINFRSVWHNRNLMDEDTTNDLTPDILWVRIESDPWWSTKAMLPWISGNVSTEGWNSVRQMIISIDKDNTESTNRAYKFKNKNKKVNNYYVDGDFDGYEIEGGLAYKYRPLFIFYKGPETYEESSTVRQSQPVILNLNTDFNGILYAPNSPVVILGNEKTWHGFVVAKEFVRLKTVDDIKSGGYEEYKDLNNKPILVKSTEVLDDDDLESKYPEENYYMETNDDDVVSIYDISDTPKYLVIDAHYVKGMEGYNDDDYVAALKKYNNISDAEAAEKIVPITFPYKDEFNAENNHQTYHVLKEYLLDESALSKAELKKHSNKNDFPKAEYAKVNYNDETKYILKNKLPYVRMYIKKSGDNYPYVPVCDIKVAKDFSAGYSVNGATLADDDHNAYEGGNLKYSDYKIDAERDMWKVVAVKSDWWNYNDSNANPLKITRVIDKNGGRYFVAKREFVASYKKMIQDGSIEMYINATEGYYTYYDYETTLANGSPGNTIRLVMDKNGNVQTKNDLVENTDYFYVTDDYKLQPLDKGWRKKIKDLDSGDMVKDYRIPEFEVVYKKSAFNLNEDSCYSYFQINDKKLNLTLKRKNYVYLNVDELNKRSYDPETGWNIEDMFFTTRRASWMD